MKPLTSRFPSGFARTGQFATALVLGGFLAGMALDWIHVSIFHAPSSTASGAASPGGSSSTALAQRPMDEALERRTRAISDFLTTASKTNTARHRRQARTALHALRREDFPSTALAAARRPVDAAALLAPLFRQWGTIDPATAAVFLQQESRTLGEARETCAFSLGAAWAVQQPAEAQAFALAQADPATRRVAVMGVMHGLARTNPQAAQRWFDQLPSMIPPPQEADFLQEWGKVDPGAALEAALSRDALGVEMGTGWTILTSWASSDPEAALAWASRLPPTPEARSCFNAIWFGWCHNEPDAALAAARRSGDEQAWKNSLRNVTFHYAITNPDAFERLAAGLSEEDRATAWSMASTASLNDDPLRSAIWRLRAKNGQVKIPEPPPSDLTKPLDPAATLAFADLHLRGDGSIYIPVLESLAEATIEQDPLGTLEWLQARPETPPHTLWRSIQTYADIDLPAALAWMDRHRLREATEHRSYYAMFIDQLADSHPSVAAAHYVQHAKQLDAPVIAARVAAAWDRKDPTRARRWVDALAPDDRLGAYSALGQVRLLDEETAVDSWLEGVSPGADRDAALAGLVTALARWSPAAAARRAMQMADASRREAAVAEVMFAWEKVDPAAWKKQQNR